MYSFGTSQVEYLAKHEKSHPKGVTVYHLALRAFPSSYGFGGQRHGDIKRIMEGLIGRGLVEEKEVKRSRRYKITPEGKHVRDGAEDLFIFIMEEIYGKKSRISTQRDNPLGLLL